MGVEEDPATGDVETGPDPLEALYRQEYDSSVRLARLLLAGSDRAEEVAQDAFVRIAPRIDELDNPAAFLRTTVVNLCRDVLRRRRTAERHPPPPASVSPAPSLPADLDPVWQAVRELPERRRTAIVLRYWADLPDTEIARMLDVRPATVRSLVRRGVASLQEVLTDDR